MDDRSGHSGVWPPRRVVAFNLARARLLRGLTQGELAERLNVTLGEAKWTKTSVAQAEGSPKGSRNRVFGVDELVAFAEVFGVPLLYFLVPPPSEDDGSGPKDWEPFWSVVTGTDVGLREVADILAEADVGPGVVSVQDFQVAAMLGALGSAAESSAGFDVDATVGSLRKLADVLELAGSYAPSEMLSPELAADVARWRSKGSRVTDL